MESSPGELLSWPLVFSLLPKTGAVVVDEPRHVEWKRLIPLKYSLLCAFSPFWTSSLTLPYLFAASLVL